MPLFYFLFHFIFYFLTYFVISFLYFSGFSAPETLCILLNTRRNNLSSAQTKCCVSLILEAAETSLKFVCPCKELLKSFWHNGARTHVAACCPSKNISRNNKSFNEDCSSFRFCYSTNYVIKHFLCSCVDPF